MSATRAMLQILSNSALAAEIYPVVAAQTATLPFVVVSSIHEAQGFVLTGATDAFDGRMSLACHARSAADADSLAERIKAVLEGLIGHEVFGGSPAASLGTVTLWKEGTDVSDYADDRSVFRRIFDWRIRWERPA